MLLEPSTHLLSRGRVDKRVERPHRERMFRPLGKQIEHTELHRCQLYGVAMPKYLTTRGADMRSIAAQRGREDIRTYDQPGSPVSGMIFSAVSRHLQQASM